MARRFLAALIGLILVGASPAVASTIALDIVTFPGYTGTSSSFMFGWRFDVNQSVTVDRLGWFDRGQDGLATTHEVGIWTDSGTLVTSVVIQAGTASVLDGEFRWEAISPVGLAAGTYRIAGLHVDSSDNFLQGAATTTISQITYTDRLFLFNPSGLEFPTGIGPESGEDGVFGPNFSIVPEPSAALLVAFSVVGLRLIRRRRSH